MKFRTRLTVDAVRYEGQPLPQMFIVNQSHETIAHERAGVNYLLPPGYALFEGYYCTLMVKPGDWIVTDQYGKHSIVKPHIFENLYEPVENPL